MGERTVEKIKKEDGEAIFIRCDVSESSEVREAVAQIKAEYGELHYLVNCAATYEGDISKNVSEIPEEDWDRTINVNLGGYFRCAKYAIPLIKKSGGGSIVNISSVSGFRGQKNNTVYCTSKAAIIGLTQCMALDFAPEIRTNCVCPGFVRIENSEGRRTPEEVEEWVKGIAAGYPMKRVATTEDIANLVLFLLSDESSFINGESIVIDGGKSVDH
jgi:NAD(P)-dependent dehydrogenase (short-subunit alcohol dehydrogenase family)